MSSFAAFHPAVDAWFQKNFSSPTDPQSRAWPLIQSGQNVLIAAPTGSGKTLAAFLAAIADLVRRGVESPLADETFVVYISPLKALSNDVQKNLAAPLAGVRTELAAQGFPDVDIRTLVRTGDTPQTERGSHLALSLERLAALTAQPPVRIGLSATQKPIEEIARFLVGTNQCHPERSEGPAFPVLSPTAGPSALPRY